MKLNLPKSWFLRMIKNEDEHTEVSAISPELLKQMENKVLNPTLQNFVNKFEKEVKGKPMRYPNQEN